MRARLPERLRQGVTALRGGRASRRDRAGFTLLELLIVMAILLLLSVVVLPAASTMLMLEQRGAARDVALMYEQLHDEAVLRNKTYRIAYNLDANTYEVEVGDAGATVFADADAARAFEERIKDKLDDADPEERRQLLSQEDFQKLSGHEYAGTFELPQSTAFKSVYTPQYDEPVRSRAADPKGSESDKGHGKDKGKDKGPRIAYSYVFPDGTAEFTLVQIVAADDPEDGYTVSVDPLSGRVQLHTELIDRHDQWTFLPDEGPRLNL
ncbi:MAG: prepilin-type N-terminal cleavage/methylation domain-containing protein [Alphaproteobacteria bacterium]|nr:prepilin-type N-terminal cleavage/methylation domain-containing protein [Alphaproteobacteria bacterium]